MVTLVWGGSIGQVWTRHLAPAAPASRPSLPTQFHDCACHTDSALQFLSLLVWGEGGLGEGSPPWFFIILKTPWGPPMVVSCSNTSLAHGYLCFRGPLDAMPPEHYAPRKLITMPPELAPSDCALGWQCRLNTSPRRTLCPRSTISPQQHPSSRRWPPHNRNTAP